MNTATVNSILTLLLLFHQATPSLAEESLSFRDLLLKKRASKEGKKERSTRQEGRFPASRKPKPPSRPAIKENQEDLPVTESPQEEETRLTKNWGGSRKTLSERGLDIALIYKGEYVSVLSGGLQTGGVYLSNIDLRLALDLGKAVAWKGGSAFIYGLGNHGGDPSKLVGDAQITSNIETNADTFKLYEAWLQQFIVEDKFSVLAGLHDLNSEFYSTESSGLFFNSSFGVGRELSQSGANGPSIFPTTAPSLRLRAEPSKSFYIQMAAFNGLSGKLSEPHGTHFSLNAHDGLLLINEAAYLRGKERSGELPAKYGFGYWTYTRTFDHLTTTVGDSGQPLQTTSSGAYFLLDQNLTSSLSIFLRYGIASTEANRFGSCLGTGTVYKGLIPRRPKDRFGFGLARASNGAEYKSSLASSESPPTDSETAYEFNYRFEALPGVAIQPAFQYVVHPNTDANIPDAKVGSIRFELSF